MPIAYERDDQRRVITLIVTEPYSVDDILSVIDRQAAEKGVRKPMATIVLIDDDDQLRRLFHSALKDAGYRVLSAAGGNEGMRLLHDQVVDVIVVDIFMPDMDGLELIPLLRKTRPATKIIAISGGSDTGNYLDVAKHLGANATLMKPFSLQELLQAVASQLQSSHP